MKQKDGSMYFTLTTQYIRELLRTFRATGPVQDAKRTGRSSIKEDVKLEILAEFNEIPVFNKVCSRKILNFATSLSKIIKQVFLCFSFCDIFKLYIGLVLPAVDSCFEFKGLKSKS